MNIILGALVIFMGVVIAALMLTDSNPVSNDNTAAAGPRSESEPMARRDPNDTMALGSIDAPVVLTEWTDFRCPYCALFSRDVLPIIIQEYVEPGLVRIEINDVSFFGEQSEAAAIAARAAGEQGKYFEFMMALYEAAPEGGHPDMPRDKLIAFAVEAGVPDIDRFTADLDRPDLLAAVRASTFRAQNGGITSVPFFVAGSTGVSGAQPIDVFRGFIEDALSKVS